MIKSFKSFFESKNAIYFEDSEDFNQVKLKHRFSDQTIKDYFSDLIDSDFEMKIICGLFDKGGDGFILNYVIALTKNYTNPLEPGKNSTSNKNYLKYLNNLTNDLQSIEDCTNLFKTSEDLDNEIIDIQGIPFSGAGANQKETDVLRVIIKVSQVVKSNDLVNARNKFQNSKTPLKVAYENLIKQLDRGGVMEARQLIDTNHIVDDDEEIIIFGFLTDDEIIEVGRFTDEDGLILYDSELKRAIQSYHDGYCQETLGF
jgi:hypothetical protein